MSNISNSVKKKDHAPKMNGSALYVDDHKIEGMLTGRLLHSSKAKAKIVSISVPPLPEGYLTVDYRDVPGVNRVAIVQNDTPVFAESQVEYIGDPILMVVGPDEKEGGEHTLVFYQNGEEIRRTSVMFSYLR